MALFEGFSSRNGGNPANAIIGIASVFGLISFALFRCSTYIRNNSLGSIATPIAWILVTTAAVFGTIALLHLLKILAAMLLVRMASRHHPG
jgi:hypothetical protein